MEISRKYGVTFHDQMDAATLVSQWKKVNIAIRKQHTDIEAAMIQAGGIQNTQVSLVEAQDEAAAIFKTVQEATETAAASLTGQATYPSTKAALEVAEIKQEISTNQLLSKQSTLYALVSK